MLIHQPHQGLYAVFFLRINITTGWGEHDGLVRLVTHSSLIRARHVLCVDGQPARFNMVCRVRRLVVSHSDAEGCQNVAIRVKPLTVMDLKCLRTLYDAFDDVRPSNSTFFFTIL